MKRGNYRNLFIAVSLFFFLVICSYTYDYIKLIILTMKTPSDSSISLYLSLNSYSLIASQLKSINDVLPIIQNTFDSYVLISFIFHIIKAFTIKEVIVLVFILIITFIKYVLLGTENSKFISSILKAMQGLIIVLLISSFSIFYVNLLESGFKWLDPTTFKIIIITILGVSCMIVFIIGCVSLYHPLKKRIYSSPLN